MNKKDLIFLIVIPLVCFLIFGMLVDKVNDSTEYFIDQCDRLNGTYQLKMCNYGAYHFSKIFDWDLSDENFTRGCGEHCYASDGSEIIIYLEALT